MKNWFGKGWFVENEGKLEGSGVVGSRDYRIPRNTLTLPPHSHSHPPQGREAICR